MPPASDFRSNIRSNYRYGLKDYQSPTIDFGSIPIPPEPTDTTSQKKSAELAKKMQDFKTQRGSLENLINDYNVGGSKNFRGAGVIIKSLLEQIRGIDKKIEDLEPRLEDINTTVGLEHDKYKSFVEQRGSFLKSQQGIVDQTFASATKRLEQELANLGILHGGALGSNLSDPSNPNSVSNQLSIEAMRNLGNFDVGNLQNISNTETEGLSALSSLRNQQRAQELAQQQAFAYNQSLQSAANSQAQGQMYGGLFQGAGALAGGYAMGGGNPYLAGGMFAAPYIFRGLGGRL